MSIFFIIGAVGIISGFLSGLFGIGRDIVMVPLLLCVSTLFGFDPLPCRQWQRFDHCSGIDCMRIRRTNPPEASFFSWQLVGWMWIIFIPLMSAYV